jgi:hypothetical protein
MAATLLVFPLLWCAFSATRLARSTDDDAGRARYLHTAVVASVAAVVVAFGALSVKILSNAIVWSAHGRS